ncbi:binding-protein-dependent transport systems inner membrane component [Beutenbergia cavernae DSM 12333]|uniref:Binding-protein-dependent transport systems inner membrane component n=1 Tax=Beutenbergia cavernae (strain ATCC BAA-8 / DSM 12333 / CCUG 43141 / JCM 11478 / NBRC 16432 / NCIMB 13614 / HKI 0122) TaxID=471853 RepID=C5BZI4_BEUC1|nr:carbohydrate ABC transporter permease [Beutenbergia cavernae]ACQ79156.1 binding-protein-dependent transport systems inner membrane component [Beutenbergia cavernae DSM 12333]
MSTTLERTPTPTPVATPPGRRRQRRLLTRLPIDGALYLTMILAILVMSVPLIWMFLASFKELPEFAQIPLQWLPESFDFSNFAQVASSIPIGRMFLNSVMITILGAGLKVILGLACAYAIVFIDVPFKKTVFYLVLFALLIPGQITIIPNYTLIADLGWLNTYQGILVPGLASAFGTFLFRQHFLSLPISVMEAAEVDGAGHWRRLWRFVVPMSVPTIAAVSLVSIVAEWNEYLWPMLVTDNTRTMTLPVGLTLLQSLDGQQNWGVLMAASALVTVPILLIFLILQRRLVAGLTAGAVTG